MQSGKFTMRRISRVVPTFAGVRQVGLSSLRGHRRRTPGAPDDVTSRVAIARPHVKPSRRFRIDTLRHSVTKPRLTLNTVGHARSGRPRSCHARFLSALTFSNRCCIPKSLSLFATRRPPYMETSMHNTRLTWSSASSGYDGWDSGVQDGVVASKFCAIEAHSCAWQKSCAPRALSVSGSPSSVSNLIAKDWSSLQ